MKYPRYPAYKDSGVEWIGEIPNEWKVKKLKWCLSKIESGNRESGGGNQLDDGIFSIGGEHIDWEGNLNLTNPKYISESFYDDLNSGKVMVSDILLVKDGATIGKVAFVQKLPDIKIAINEHVFLIRTNNLLYSKFLYYVLYSKIGQAQIELNVRGAAQGGLNLSFVQRLFVTIPSIELQKEVSLFLDRKIEQLNRFIHKESQFIELLKESRKAIITNAVTKGLDHSVPMKNSGVVWIGEIPEHWKVIKLKSASIFNPPKSEIKGYSRETPVSFFPMESIGDDGKLEHLYFRPISEVINGYTYFKNGDVVIAKITPCFENGKGALIEGMKSELGFGTTELIVIRPLPILTKSFLYFLTITGLFRNLGEGAMQGASGQKRVPEKFVTNFKFGLPPLGEQIQISNYVKVNIHKIDDLISKQQKMIEFLNEYKTSLITHAVTGKIDVRGFAVPTDSKSA